MFRPLMVTGEVATTRSTPRIALVPSIVAAAAPVVWIVVAVLMSICGLPDPKTMTSPLVTLIVEPGFRFAFCTASRRVHVVLPAAQLPTVVSAPSVTVYVGAASAVRGSVPAARTSEMTSAAATADQDGRRR